MRRVEAKPPQCDDGSGPDATDEHGRIYLTLLFNKYRGSLFRYLTGLVSSPEDADELVQESYTRLLRQEGVAQLDAVGRTYLFRTATNLARDYFRRRTTRSARNHIDIDELQILDEGGGPEKPIVWDQTVRSVKEAIRELPPLTRRIFLLSRFRAKTYPQIAHMLGISTRTIERKMKEAMTALAARLEESP